MARKRYLIFLVVSTLLLAACGGDEAADSTAASEDPTTTAAANVTTTQAEDASAEMTNLALTSTDLGDVLAGEDGYVVYMFMPDEQNAGVSNCEDECLANWPALGEVEAGEGVDAGLVGTITRSDGSTQTTYNGWPLYYFVNDTAPGETSGQGVNDVWFVMGPDGNPIGTP